MSPVLSRNLRDPDSGVPGELVASAADGARGRRHAARAGRVPADQPRLEEDRGYRLETLRYSLEMVAVLMLVFGVTADQSGLEEDRGYR